MTNYKTYTHKPTGKQITFGGRYGESMQRLISKQGALPFTLEDIVTKGKDWEVVADYYKDESPSRVIMDEVGTWTSPHSDRIMSMGMLLASMKKEVLSKLGIPEEKQGQFPNIHKIWDTSLINDILNYKPRIHSEFGYTLTTKNKSMKKFKNRFAVHGDIIDLLRFERELLKLGYKLRNDRDVFNYRGASNDPASHITVGVHHWVGSDPGTYTPAMNNGSASYDFALSKRFDDAVKFAAEEERTPVLITEDGVEKFDGDDVWYVRRQLTHYHWKSISNFKEPDGYHFFSTEEGCLKYIDENKKQYSKVDILNALKENTNWNGSLGEQGPFYIDIPEFKAMLKL